MRVRFTLRSIMVLVAIIALVLWAGLSTAKRYNRYADMLKICDEMEIFCEQDHKNNEAGRIRALKEAEKWQGVMQETSDLHREFAAWFAEQVEFDLTLKKKIRKTRIDLWWKIANPFAR